MNYAPYKRKKSTKAQRIKSYEMLAKSAYDRESFMMAYRLWYAEKYNEPKWVEGIYIEELLDRDA